eukprot:CAMPEP_0196655494 /NCGR_PEP_ID=MMETSP1086-20130531/5243_1 /TAXON_ID=77921 /ORGANISM="Cyanoptyche  gloeocystis , Strain SAG4.97" /LENGTH=260 /DNA_ID=CAMNT_0041987839 /DNA_START=100 /DNA_END=882 /DNA_ORIENTATION=-
MRKEILLLLGVVFLAFFSPAQATVTFTNPVSGSIFYRGGAYAITYTDTASGTNPTSYTFKWKIGSSGTETVIASTELSAATISGTSASITWTIPTTLTADTNYILTAYNSGGTSLGSTASFSIQVPAITNLRLSIPVGTTVNASIAFTWAGPTGYGLDLSIYSGTSTTGTALVTQSVVTVSGTSQSFLVTLTSAGTVLMNEIDVEATAGQTFATKVVSPTDSSVVATATYTVTNSGAGFANRPAFWMLSAFLGAVVMLIR